MALTVTNPIDSLQETKTKHFDVPKMLGIQEPGVKIIIGGPSTPLKR